MNRRNLSRRGFVAKSVGGLAAAGLPIWFAKEITIDAQEKKTSAQPAANDRIVMGAIGTGTNRLRRGNRALHGERGRRPASAFHRSLPRSSSRVS